MLEYATYLGSKTDSEESNIFYLRLVKLLGFRGCELVLQEMYAASDYNKEGGS